jgi:hypothetical protein
MSIRFAAPPSAFTARIGPEAIGRFCGPSANDDGDAPASDAMLHAALRHFAEHGLAAAARACKQAEVAFTAGDRQGFEWWLDVCRALDRRMAKDLAARTERPVSLADSR